ncbi:hypothetical protein GCM10025864_18850 [Luteimicrobium album]|uniref:Amidohydrolase 3 domain-containing protein n=1 Tax=Luteimicrobium album TaxID=1054550 RepID=A0ABQ6I0A9_9MICO|nr:amidohydrolase family protein [Luteimicrobium album]GMA24126.1 hypothetical protein GCM10025864_18850 [Luteimicrobium album]
MILTNARLRGRAGLWDVEIADGLVRRVGAVVETGAVQTGAAPADAVPTDDVSPSSSDERDTVVDLSGRVVVPGMVESHLHLDKAWLGGPAGGVGLAGAIVWTTRRKASFTVEDVASRAEHVARLAASNGTTLIRAHTEVDPGVGLVGVQGCSRPPPASHH